MVIGLKKKTVETKGFAFGCLLFGIIGLLIMAHHIFSYEAVLRPFMDYLVENKILTNNISGAAFLRMFTNESNIFVDVYLILYAFGIFGSKKLYKFTHNEVLRGTITLNIAITGIIYFTVLLPFGGGTFPKEAIDNLGVMRSTGPMWFTSIVNTWNHLITPVLFTAFWFLPVSDKKLPVAKTTLKYLIYPMCYFVMCEILGAKDGFYPYPFLNGKQMFDMLFKGQEYSSTTGFILLAAAFVLLLGIFYGAGCGLNAIHNKRINKKQK